MSPLEGERKPSNVRSPYFSQCERDLPLDPEDCIRLGAPSD
jgi:hypothetical protein